MRYCTKVRPGRRGTKTLLAAYGDRLLCVRYRYDDVLQARLKTAEIIVSKSPWKPPVRHDTPRLVQVRTAPHETDLHQVIRQAGGRWDSHLAVWFLPAERARNLGLADRVVQRTQRPRRVSGSKNKTGFMI